MVHPVKNQMLPGYIVEYVQKRRSDLELHFDDAHLKSPFGGDCGNLIIKLPGRGNAAAEKPLIVSWSYGYCTSMCWCKTQCF